MPTFLNQITNLTFSSKNCYGFVSFNFLSFFPSKMKSSAFWVIALPAPIPWSPKSVPGCRVQSDLKYNPYSGGLWAYFAPTFREIASQTFKSVAFL